MAASLLRARMRSNRSFELSAEIAFQENEVDRCHQLLMAALEIGAQSVGVGIDDRDLRLVVAGHRARDNELAHERLANLAEANDQDVLNGCAQFLGEEKGRVRQHDLAGSATGVGESG